MYICSCVHTCMYVCILFVCICAGLVDVVVSMLKGMRKLQGPPPGPVFLWTFPQQALWCTLVGCSMLPHEDTVGWVSCHNGTVCSSPSVTQSEDWNAGFSRCTVNVIVNHFRDRGTAVSVLCWCVAPRTE